MVFSSCYKITTEFFVANKQWDVHIERGQNEFSRLNKDEVEITILITVALRRHGSRLAIIYVLPAFGNLHCYNL